MKVIPFYALIVRIYVLLSEGLAEASYNVISVHTLWQHLATTKEKRVRDV